MWWVGEVVSRGSNTASAPRSTSLVLSLERPPIADWASSLYMPCVRVRFSLFYMSALPLHRTTTLPHRHTATPPLQTQKQKRTFQETRTSIFTPFTVCTFGTSTSCGLETQCIVPSILSCAFPASKPCTLCWWIAVFGRRSFPRLKKQVRL